MIHAIVLDVDGVVVGPRSDQYPHPSTRLTNILRDIQSKGILVSLLSGKTSFVIGETIKQIGLEGLHVADSGAVVFDAINDVSVFENTIEPAILNTITAAFSQTDISLHAFSRLAYAQMNRFDEEFEKHYIHIMGRDPAARSFQEFVAGNNILKLNIYASDDRQKREVDDILLTLSDRDMHVNPWSLNPALEGVSIRNITSAGVSKYSGFSQLLKHLEISPEHVLGVGDTLHDWDFIEHCGFKGVMGNATMELKEKFNLEHDNQHMGGHIDDDGLIDIFEYFNIV